MPHHPVLEVDHVSKQFQVAAARDRYPTLREAIYQSVSRRWTRVAGGRAKHDQVRLLNALRDISFSVSEGDVVGLIGRNGAGKSTLLKILCRITPPSAGEVRVRGRVGALLEVGTGFHPELTGRENIYLNGSILGMTKRDIDARFDAIVDFSGVSEMLDVPVKRYSSGMHVRLAFAVAAHLEPDILLIDEVLAVGDADFQRRCLAKMKDVAQRGRTILFVSHNMGLVQSLCRRAILLTEGQIASDGPARDVVTSYLQRLEADSASDLAERTDRAGDGPARIVAIDVATSDHGPRGTVAAGHPARFTFRMSEPIARAACSFTIYDQQGYPVTYFNSANTCDRDDLTPDRVGAFQCSIDALPLVPGRYRINAAVQVADHFVDHVEGAATFYVEDGSLDGRAVPRDAGYGSIMISHRWTAT